MTKHINPRTRGIVAVRADATGEVRKTLAELMKTFEDFKAANDERLAGKADVVTDEKVEKINASVTDLQGKLEEATKAAEKAASEAQARMDDLEKDANRLRAGGIDKPGDRDFLAEAQVFHAGINGRESARIGDDEAQAYQKYTETFARFLKQGTSSNIEVQAAMSVGSEPDGGAWVPTQMANRIIERLFETSPMRQVSNVLSITTDSIEFPNDTNDATTGGWVGENTARPATATQQVGDQRIYVREQYAMPEVTQKLLDMATINVESWIGDKIADKLSRVENTAFVSGTGVNQPRGFLDYSSAAVTTDDTSRSWGVLQYVPSGAAGGIPALSGVPSASDADAFVTMISKLKPAYRQGATWLMNRATEAAIRKMKDGDGRYLVGMGDIRDGVTGFNLFGFTIVTAEDMPDISSDTFSVAFGNFGVGYQIVDGRGIRTLRDPYTNKPYVRFYTTKWTGGDVVNFDAVKLMKFATS